MNRQTKYRRQIECMFHWDKVVTEARANVETDHEGNRIGYAYLGSCLSLYPSGKYYLPFACSNLNPCKRCKGSGLLKTTYNCEICKGSGSRVIQEHMTGFINAGLAIGDAMACNYCSGSGKRNNTCDWCNGSGSLEATQDEIFGEQLEHVAGLHGGSITSGEGDGTDVFFALSVDSDDDDETEPVSPATSDDRGNT